MTRSSSLKQRGDGCGGASMQASSGAESVDPRIAQSEIVAGDAAQAIVQFLIKLPATVEALVQQQAQTLADIDQLKLEHCVLEDLSDQNRSLREAFHEREVLNPLLRSLIGVADRIREGQAQLEQMLEDSGDDPTSILQTVLDARTADLMEIEDLLAGFGVESYEHQDSKFDASLQKCVKRIQTTRSSCHERIATRLRPGYRRDDKIIRERIRRHHP